MDYTDLLIQAFKNAVNQVLPDKIIYKNIKIDNHFFSIQEDKYPLKNFYLFGSGKASIKMAQAVEDLFKDYIKGGLIVSNYKKELKKVEVFESSHPIPDERSIKAGRHMLEKLSSLKEDDFFVYLLSGGSSALIEYPIPPISLQDLRLTTDILLKSGVSIDEVNIIRKHISLIKGGRLAKATKASGIVLVLSDVIGDDLETIGSAPFYFDKSTYKDAYLVLDKYGLLNKIPSTVLTVIEKGLKGEIEETPKEPPKRIKHYIIGNNLTALNGAKDFLTKKGIKAFILSSEIEGEAKEVAKVIVGIGKDIKKGSSYFFPPVVLLFGGETTVTVKGSGKGGRNQELVLSALLKIKDNCGIHVLSAGTDGIDGVTDAAGAVADCSTYKEALERGLDLEMFLENNDSYNFFKKVGKLIKTGYTGTNVMDITMLLVEGR
ncbi:MAG: glycerate kinase [Aquificae bacterium]|nr:glycerate kinase [Aquificota bacterium]